MFSLFDYGTLERQQVLFFPKTCLDIRKLLRAVRQQQFTTEQSGDTHVVQLEGGAAVEPETACWKLLFAIELLRKSQAELQACIDEPGDEFEAQ